MKMGSYDEKDIQTWLSNMKTDIKKNIVKVSEIRKVSLDQSDINNITKQLSLAGMECIKVGTLSIPKSDNIIGWTISATKT